MGLGFNLAMVFIVAPLTVILLVAWPVTGKKLLGKILGLMWLGVVGIVILSATIQWLIAKKVLRKNDYYGKYIVNRDYFKGEQADWQYNTFRFEIKENDSIFFYVTDGERVLQTYRGTITTTTSYASERLVINMQQPTHHVVSDNPTTFRTSRNFYLVFHSPRFNNVFFKKGKWSRQTEQTIFK